jgi:hypothetical protein
VQFQDGWAQSYEVQNRKTQSQASSIAKNYLANTLETRIARGTRADGATVYSFDVRGSAPPKVSHGADASVRVRSLDGSFCAFLRLADAYSFGAPGIAPHVFVVYSRECAPHSSFDRTYVRH